MALEIINIGLRIQVETNDDVSTEAFDRFVDSMIPRFREMYPISRGAIKATLLRLTATPKRENIKKPIKKIRRRPSTNLGSLYRR